MSWKKILFVFNPVSGKSQIRGYLLDILQILSGAGYEVVCYPTTKAGDARRRVRERETDYLYVACAGGDGTLDEVVAGMMENPDKPFCPVGYIPAGTTNDFASSLGIPSDMREAAKVIAHGRAVGCDLGQFNGTEYFTYVAAFGIFTETSYATPQQLKNQIGHLAYILQGITEISRLKTYRVHVETDDMFITDEFAYGMVTNSHSVGGFAKITGANVDLTDGLFEVTLIKMPRNVLEINEILSYLNNGVPTPLVYHFKADHVIFESEEELKWTRDGEYGGECCRAELRALRHQLHILVPQKNATELLADRTERPGEGGLSTMASPLPVAGQMKEKSAQE